MTITIQSEDFGDDGALSTTRFGTGVADFYNTEGRTYASVAPSSTDSACTLTTFDPAGLLTASTPKVIRYEIDFKLPDTFPATGEIRAGFHALCRSTDRDGLRLVYRRTSGGVATYVELLIARVAGSALSDVSLYLVPVTALAAGATGRLRLDVTLSTFCIATAYLDGALAFTSTPSLTSFNLATGRSLTTFANSTGYARLIVTSVGTAIGPVFPPSAPQPTGVIAVNRTFLDRLRVSDAGNLAVVPSFAVEPALVGAPVRSALIPVTESADASGETLPVAPSYVVQITDRYRVTEHPYSGGYKATVAGNTTPRREWSLGWEAMTPTEYAAMRAMNTAAYGIVRNWTFNDPETGAAIVCRFISALTFKLVAPSVYEAAADVREVR